MTTNGQVVYDPEEINQLLTDIEVRLRKIRSLGLEGAHSAPINFEAHAFDLDGIKWKLKGGSPATLDDGFAYDYTSDRSGIIYKEKVALVEYLKKASKLIQNGFTITLSKDGKFLNRSKNKTA